jgi:hypothetical protein
MSSSSASNRKRGGQQSPLFERRRELARAPTSRTRENLEQAGGWSPAQLIRMDADFCAAMELAISRGGRPPDGKAR